MIPTLALPKSGYKGRSSVTSSQPAYELPLFSESIAPGGGGVKYFLCSQAQSFHA